MLFIIIIIIFGLSHPLISQPVQDRAMCYLSVSLVPNVNCLALVGKSFNDR